MSAVEIVCLLAAVIVLLFGIMGWAVGMGFYVHAALIGGCIALLVYALCVAWWMPR